jgi:uncharacterized membrane protein YbhN (UPF0104 family)
MMSPNVKKTMTLLLKVGVTAFVTGVLIRMIGWTQIVDALARTRWQWLLVMYTLLLGSRVVYALEMKVVLRRVGAPVGLGRVFLANSLSILYSLVLPGDLFASAAKWGNLSAATGKKSVVFNAIVYNRFALLLPPLFFGAIALALENPFPETPFAELVASVVVAMIVVMFGLYHPRLGPYVDNIVRRVASPLPTAVYSRVEMILVSMAGFRSLRFTDHIQIFAIGSLGVTMSVLVFLSAVNAMGIAVPSLVLIWTQTILIALRQIPITISNLGVREGFLIYVFGQYGILPESAFAVGMLAFSNILLMAFIGLVYQLTLFSGIARWEGRETIETNATKAVSDLDAPEKPVASKVLSP